eukprot:TRINITY_DN3821_c1_g3_i1.p1 TRINITY_DN3821_c1_g3~~TRINITY_DN3821_c1_g3_i1.p1  ORF type:complete len:327 (-),score=146.63 TRINITY_DN3821_c1_g3_i1:66-995(-)
MAINLKAKAAQGELHMKAALDCLETGFFKWTADYEGAILEFERAANCFRQSKEFLKSINAFQRAAETAIICNLQFSAAKHFESASNIAKEIKQYDSATDLLIRAANNTKEAGNLERSIDILVKAAKVSEESNPNRAIEIYNEALDIIELCKISGLFNEAFKCFLNFLYKQKKFDLAIGILLKHIEFLNALGQNHNINKAYLCLIILHLTKDDVVAAERTYETAIRSNGFTESNEGGVAGELIDAFDKRLPELLATCLSKQVFTFLDNQICHIARSLRIPGGSNETSISIKLNSKGEIENFTTTEDDGLC